MQENKSKKVGVGVIIGIIVGFIIIGLVALAIIMVISAKQVNSTISNSRQDSFISTYKMIQREIEVKIANNENASCDGDCSLLYNYDDSSFDVEVTDMIDYYKIDFEVDDDKYRNFKFTNDACSNLSDAVCDENEIIGRVYKQN